MVEAKRVALGWLKGRGGVAYGGGIDDSHNKIKEKEAKGGGEQPRGGGTRRFKGRRKERKKNEKQKYVHTLQGLDGYRSQHSTIWKKEGDEE